MVRTSGSGSVHHRGGNLFFGVPNIIWISAEHFWSRNQTYCTVCSTPLNLLWTWQARFLCRDSDYFWTVYGVYIYQLIEHCRTLPYFQTFLNQTLENFLSPSCLFVLSHLWIILSCFSIILLKNKNIVYMLTLLIRTVGISDLPI